MTDIDILESEKCARAVKITGLPCDILYHKGDCCLEGGFDDFDVNLPAELAVDILTAHFLRWFETGPWVAIIYGPGAPTGDRGETHIKSGYEIRLHGRNRLNFWYETGETLFECLLNAVLAVGEQKGKDAEDDKS